MKVLFIQGNSPLSKAIMAVTEEEISHVVLEVGDIVVHSNLTGVRLEWADNYRRKHKVVHELRVPYNKEALRSLMGYEFSMYNFGALLFTGLNLLTTKYFNFSINKNNLWSSSKAFMCTEVVTMYLYHCKDPNITPMQLYHKIKEQTCLTD